MAFNRRKGWEQTRLILGLAGLMTPHIDTTANVPVRVSGHRWVEGPALLAAMGVEIA